MMIKNSTQAFIREAYKLIKTKRYSFFDLVHGYVYMRWPYLYISIGLGRHPLARAYKTLLSGKKKENEFISQESKKRNKSEKGIAEGYHGKAVPLSTAIQLISIKKGISLENLEQVIPFERARDIVIKNPQKIVVLDCPCRKAQINPCYPLDVCLIIGDPFASFVLEHHPKKSRAINANEALVILEQEHARGHVHHAFFKDALLNRFYAICNCCACCCGAMQAQRNGTPMIISSGFMAEVDEDLCIECGICVDVCQFGAITLNGVIQIDKNLCMGCGVCVDRCAQSALKLKRDFSKPAPLDIKSMYLEATNQVEIGDTDF